MSVLLLLGASRVAWATPIVAFTHEPAELVVAQDSTRGWQFDVLAAGGITVSHLGVFDAGADGLAEAHAVGIWNSAGTLLTSAIVSSGTANPLDVNGLFRLVDIADLFLSAGTGYRIGAHYDASSTDGVARGPGVLSQAFHPAIQYLGERAVLGGTLANPGQSFGFDSGYFGPAFEIVTPTPVPEPGSLLLAGWGLAAICRWVRARRAVVAQTLPQSVRCSYTQRTC